MVSKKKTCAICHKSFEPQDLFPNALIRDPLFEDMLIYLPDLNRKGSICFPDYRLYSAKYYEKILEKERGRLSKLEKEVLDSIKEHEFIAENTNEQFEEKLTVGEKISDMLAKFGGSWFFIVSFLVVLVSWMFINTKALLTDPFDPYPFILLNLVLSCLAAIQAPVILMSQNRQNFKDRLKSDQDYIVNLKSEMQIRQLNSRFDIFMKHQWQLMNTLIKSHEEILEEIEDVQRATKQG